MQDFQPCSDGDSSDSPNRELPNFHRINDRLFRGGQPSRKGLESLRTSGIKTVINLREETSSIETEDLICRTIGIDFISIPLRPFAVPETDHLLAFLSVTETIDKQPCFVHCLHGMDRTGLMVALYRLRVEDWTYDEAYREMLSHGFHEGFTNLTSPLTELARLWNKLP
ncbi:MAG: tyrosine-protein phosphatase [Candidatus Melainabacteria bacterium]|nr:tyrosine-protein phosphatase [Candidatus Melainabacteria bacterium]